MNLTKKSGKADSYSIEWIRWALVWLLGAAIVFINLYFTARQSSWMLIVENILVIAVIIGVVSFTNKGKRFWSFVKEAKMEMHKIVWSTRKETVQSAIVVIIVVLIAAVFLWGVDNILLWALNLFAGQRG
jgi:preprotein translocase subunit SecE